MAQPVSIRNDRDQSIDTIFTVDGDKKIKLGVGLKNIGLTDEAAWQGVASHTDGEAFEAGDGLAVIGGVDGSGNVHRFLVDANNRVVAAIAPQQGVLTDRSGSLAAGNTSQQMMASNATRKYLLIQNVDTAEDLWFTFGGSAAVKDQPSLKLAPGGSFVMEGSFISTEAVQVIALTTGHKWSAKEA